ncbi:MAG: hypothetical protein V3T49_00165 [Dehalococcoidia bacterium]
MVVGAAGHHLRDTIVCVMGEGDIVIDRDPSGKVGMTMFSVG